MVLARVKGLPMPSTTSSDNSSWHTSLRSLIICGWVIYVGCVGQNFIVGENSVMTCLPLENGVCTSGRPVDAQYYCQWCFQLILCTIGVSANACRTFQASDFGGFLRGFAVMAGLFICLKCVFWQRKRERNNSNFETVLSLLQRVSRPGLNEDVREWLTGPVNVLW